MEVAADLAAGFGAELVIVLQPSLVEREWKSPVEESLLEATMQAHTSAEALREAYEAMRQGLGSLAKRKGLHFLDCSRLFTGERATTFADLWHFFDFGNELLGKAIAREVAPLLERRRSARTDR
jgi:lysophospholipase L1-like esterase